MSLNECLTLVVVWDHLPLCNQYDDQQQLDDEWPDVRNEETEDFIQFFVGEKKIFEDENKNEEKGEEPQDEAEHNSIWFASITRLVAAREAGGEEAISDHEKEEQRRCGQTDLRQFQQLNRHFGQSVIVVIVPQLFEGP